eukprot:symbB.v1.2.040100.t1/scaffold6989.1/size14025/1
MSGKSTLMRALGACALLANCGFLCPCKPKAVIPQYRQVVWVSAEGDRPAEGISAFGHEALISAALLRRASHGTLALVDEFGRGTEPRAAKAAVCTLIEELSARETQFVVATHLHDVVDVKLRLHGLPPVAWRMGVRRSSDGGQFGSWTYQLEHGVCRDSLAAQTLEHFGWPTKALQRFDDWLQELENQKMDGKKDHHMAPDKTEDGTNDDCLAESSTLDEADKTLDVIMEMMSSLAAIEVIKLKPHDMPPAPLCAGAAVVYALLLQQNVYVGQSDNLQQRLRQHQQRFGDRLEDVLLVPVANTAMARQLETQLQRQLLRHGIALEGGKDA